MGSNQRTTKSESLSVSLTKVEKEMFRNVKRHYGFASDRDLVIALLKRAHLTVEKKA